MEHAYAAFALMTLGKSWILTNVKFVFFSAVLRDLDISSSGTF